MNFQHLINYYLNVQKNFRSAKAYSGYVSRFQTVIQKHCQRDIAKELTNIIQNGSGSVIGYDPVADALSFFDKMVANPCFPYRKPKTINNWRTGYAHFVKTIIGKYYANTWLSVIINDKILCDMIAKSAIFADPQVVKDVISGALGTKNNKGIGNLDACWDHYAKCRDNNVKKGQQTKDRNGLVCIADDNTEANKAIKNAVLASPSMNGIKPAGGYRLFKDYEACHIWGLVDDCHYYTSIANLVLIPRAISGLSDHCQAVKEMLQYEAYKRFKILPKGQTVPKRPQFYNHLEWR